MSDRDETTGATTPSGATDTTPPSTGAGGRLARNMIVYTLLRLLMVVVLTAAIVGVGMLFDVRVPILVAGLVSVVIALPLSMMLFPGLRAEINADIAAVDSGRREKRDDLRRRMDEA